MLANPAFAKHVRVDVIEGFGLQVTGHKLLRHAEGDVFARVAAKVREGASSQQILEQARDADDRLDIQAALVLLEQEGVLVERTSESPGAPEDAYWRLLGAEASFVSRTASAFEVDIQAVGHLPGDLVGQTRRLLGGLGFPQRLTQPAAARLTVILAEDYLHRDLAEINAKSIREKRPWLLVRPAAVDPWIGPLLVPGETGCWACLAHRLRFNRPGHAHLLRKDEQDGFVRIPPAFLPQTVSLALQMLAVEIARWAVLESRTPTYGTLLSLDTAAWDLQRHVLVKRPQCSACGTPPPHDPRIELESRAVAASHSDGGHRVIAAQELCERFSHHISGITGVVPWIRPKPNASALGFYIYASGYNRAIPDLNTISKKHLRQFCSGKGKSDAQARASALAEAIERVSCEPPDANIFQHRKRLRDFPDGTAVSPLDLTLFSEAQYRDREAINRVGSKYHNVPRRFDPDQVLEWTDAWSLRDRAVRHLPTQYCWFGYADRATATCYPDSNGVAAGSSREDAIVQAFLELVERDAVAIWFYNQIPRPAVDLDSLDEPYIQHVRRTFASLGRDLWVIDITHDLGIPSFVAHSRRLDRRPGDEILQGFGAHFDASIAFSRAVTELVQMGIYYVERRDGIWVLREQGPEGYADWSVDVRTWFEKATVESQGFLLPSAEPARPLSRYPKHSPKDMREEVDRCVELCRGHGLDFIVLDCTRPDIGLPVVRVVVPGLRHFWRRLAPGRLYDVPVQMGWLPDRKREDQLNPLSVYL